MALSLANRRTDLPMLEAAINAKVLVHASTIAKRINRTSDSIWHIHADALGDKFLSSVTLLAENMVDAELYQYAAKHYQVHAAPKSVTSRSTARGGGGSQIDVELDMLLGGGFPVMAITDGDCSSPTAQRSIISKRCDELIDGQHGIGWHIALPAREIENIIPLKILKEVADPQLASLALDSVCELAATSAALGSCPENFVCLKRGLCLSKVFQMDDLDQRKYWLGVADKINGNRPKRFRECLNSGECRLDPCSCDLSTGFGDAVLSQVKRWLAERSTQESLKSFKGSDIWMQAGKLIFEVSVAFKPSAV